MHYVLRRKVNWGPKALSSVGVERFLVIMSTIGGSTVDKSDLHSM